jgi:hypothetical protein
MLGWKHLLILEPILELLLHGTHFLLKRVVNRLLLAVHTGEMIDHHLLIAIIVSLKLLLLYNVLYKCLFVH